MGYSNISFPKETKFLVTGGAGFIGSNIVEALLAKGHYVRILDNISTGKASNLDLFINNPNLELILGDIRNLDICQLACHGMDYVLHQAAWGSVPKSIEMPIIYEEINIKGTLNMLIASKEQKVKRFIYASSSSVYGDSQILPKIETITGVPLSPYAITKRVNELYAFNFYKLYGLESIGLRYFNVFGRRQDPTSYYAAVIPKFIQALLNDTPSIINGDGSSSRDFTYIDNVIEANFRACIAPPFAIGKVFNIAYGDQISLNILYSTLQQLLNKNIPPMYGSPIIGDIKDSYADIHQAKEFLNYHPDHDFYAGIKLTVDWYKKNHKRNESP